MKTVVGRSEASQEQSLLMSSPSEKPTPASRRRRGSLDGGAETSVGVFCRFRPPNERERALAQAGVGELEYLPQQVVLHEGPKRSKKGARKFNLDRVFDPASEQATVYEVVARDMVESIVHGFNGTIFAYGQTGSGKSYSMMGPSDLVSRLGTGDVVSEEKGIIPRAVDHLFALMLASPGAEFKVSVSYLEVYQEQISDLLVPDRANTNLKLTEYVKGRFEAAGLTRKDVTSAQEVVKCLSDGDACRTIRATDMNDVSSRSHAVLEIRVMRENADGSSKTGMLNLVDLAGSESVKKTGTSGEGLKEAQKINKSLSALSGVIKSLSDGDPHVPYRCSFSQHVLRPFADGLLCISDVKLVI
jgi:kinesin family protein 5